MCCRCSDEGFLRVIIEGLRGPRADVATRVAAAAMKPHEIQEKLGLTRIRDRNWYVQPACAMVGDGLYEGLTWLMSNAKS